MTDVALIVIAKAPVAGLVKTRLCPPCTPAEAAALARAALSDTLDAALATAAGRTVLVLEGTPGPWVPPGIDVLPQVEGGLARRLAGAFDAVGGPALLIGMDTPQVESSLLRAAMSELERDDCDCVLGPALDGGWWAIGLRRPEPAVFHDVPMSVSWTGSAQRARLRELGLRHRELPTLRDVDTIDDARAIASLSPATGFAQVLRDIEAAVQSPVSAGIAGRV